MRTELFAALLALQVTAAAAHPPHHAPAIVQRMTAEFDYALRNRLVDRDAFWFATYELRGHAFPNDGTVPAFDLSCVGASWGNEQDIIGEEAMCRLSGEAGVIFARLTDIKDMRGETVLEFSLNGGRGVFAGLGGRATAHRALDLSGERPTGRGTMLLRLALVATAVEGE
jgi:hypothetical protein